MQKEKKKKVAIHDLIQVTERDNLEREKKKQKTWYDSSKSNDSKYMSFRKKTPALLLPHLPLLGH